MVGRLPDRDGEVSTNSRPVVSVVAMLDDLVHKPQVLLFFMRPDGLAAYIPFELNKTRVESFSF
jgi:hypothetical protein